MIIEGNSEMFSEKISVIVPIYNAELYLRECIESIINQTYKNLEIILINDGSTDQSLLICEEYSVVDNRIKIINKQNSGVSDSRNRGIEVASGDFVGFVDSDDTIHKRMYETMLKEIISNLADVAVLSNYTVNTTHYNYKGTDTISSEEGKELLTVLKFPTSLWAYLYRFDVIEDTRLNKDLFFFEDFEFNYRVLKDVTTIVRVPEKLYNYRTNETSVNNEEISVRKLSCLNIYDIIKNIDSSMNISMSQYFRAHFSIAMILTLSKQGKREKKYEIRVKDEVVKMLPEIVKSEYVPKKYKLLLTIYRISPKITYKILKIRRKIN